MIPYYVNNRESFGGNCKTIMIATINYVYFIHNAFLYDMNLYKIVHIYIYYMYNITDEHNDSSSLGGNCKTVMIATISEWIYHT